MFDRYFPPKGTGPKERGKLQNFPQTTYYPDWFSFMTRLSPRQAEFVRSRVLVEFKKLKWLPHADTDRMWPTKLQKAAIWTLYPEGSAPGPCPQIAVNLGTWGNNPIVLGPAMAQDEQEGEGAQVQGADMEVDTESVSSIDSLFG